MIPVTPGDALKALDAVKELIDLIRRPERANKLKRWADLLGPMPDDPDDAADVQHERATFLIALTQDLGFTPWYAYNASIAVPKDMMADLVDILVMGPAKAKTGWLSGLFGTKKPKDEYEEWADVIASGKEADILDCLTKFLTQSGRTRHYEDGAPTIKVDRDWLSDAGMAVLNQM
jgi:hypothetical protein